MPFTLESRSGYNLTFNAFSKGRTPFLIEEDPQGAPWPNAIRSVEPLEDGTKDFEIFPVTRPSIISLGRSTKKRDALLHAMSDIIAMSGREPPNFPAGWFKLLKIYRGLGRGESEQERERLIRRFRALSLLNVSKTMHRH